MVDHTKPPDRRVQRSRDVLLDALRALLMERGYEQLTVQNIIDRAGVGRATFYAHFESKDDLLASSVGRLRDMLLRAGAPFERGQFGFSLPFFVHLHGHRAIYVLTICRDSEITVERYIRDMLRHLVQREVTSRAQPTDVELLAIEYVVGALWSSIVWWMDTGSALTPDEVDGRFRQLTLPALAALTRTP